MDGYVDEEEERKDGKTVEVEAWTGWQSEQNLSGAGVPGQTAWQF